jgi:hypothetical protein
MKTDWFELREARLHLAPYSDPRFEIAVGLRGLRERVGVPDHDL